MFFFFSFLFALRACVFGFVRDLVERVSEQSEQCAASERQGDTRSVLSLNQLTLSASQRPRLTWNASEARWLAGESDAESRRFRPTKTIDADLEQVLCKTPLFLSALVNYRAKQERSFTNLVSLASEKKRSKKG
jgi:hypothetical protein